MKILNIYATYLDKQKVTPKKDFKLFVNSSSTHIISIVSSIEKQQRVLSNLATNEITEFKSDFHDMDYPVHILETYGAGKERVFRFFETLEDLMLSVKSQDLKSYSAYQVDEDYVPKKLGSDCMGIMNHSHENDK